jgi:hypothetical protein
MFVFALGLIAAGSSSATVPPATQGKQPDGLPEAVVKQTKPIFDGKTLNGWIQIPAASWEVKDGVMASTGAAAA